MKKTKNLLLALGTGALIITAATACTSNTAATPSASATRSPWPTPSPTATPTATSSPMSAVAPGEEYNEAEAKQWVDGLTQNIDPATIRTGISGHVGPESSTTFTLTDTELDPGSYSYYFVCRGDGDITFTIENAGAAVTSIEGACTGSPQGGSFTTTEVGTDLVVVSMDAPLDYVLRVTDELPL
jgi:hypothetical protein